MKAHRPLILLFFTLLVLLSIVGCNLSTHTDELSDSSSKDVRIVFDGRRFEFFGDRDAVDIDGDVLTIKRSGTYILSGKLSEGRIAVSAPGDVRLVLDGAELNSSYGAVISREDGGRLILEASPDTVNLLSSGNYRDPENIFPTACVYTSGTLELRGEGKIALNSKAECGVLSEDRILIEDADLTVKASKYGLWVRDRFQLSSGKLTVSYAEIGIYVCSDEHSRGDIIINGGELVAVCRDTVLQAGRLIHISGGTADVDCPCIYRCERTADGKSVKGVINISAEGFPKPKEN